MTWIAPSEKDTANGALEKRLWDSAHQFRANCGLNAQEYSGPILGIIFLRFAEVRFTAQRAEDECERFAARRRAELEAQGEADLLNLLDAEVKKLPKRRKGGKK